MFSTQSPECERGRGDHKLPQPYGQPSPGVAHLLCYYSCMDLRGYDVLVVDARAACSGGQEEEMLCRKVALLMSSSSCIVLCGVDAVCRKECCCTGSQFQ